MTSLGGFLWIVALGVLFYSMMRKGGGCCGGHDQGNKNQSGHEDHNGNDNHAVLLEQIEDNQPS